MGTLDLTRPEIRARAASRNENGPTPQNRSATCLARLQWFSTSAASTSSPAAVACARANGVWALCVADAGRLPVASGSVDRVLVNPPWEQQVASLGVLAGAPARLWESIRRVLRPDGLVAAIVPSVALPGFRVQTSLEVRIAGRPALLVLASPA